MLKTIELFAGAGGLGMGLSLAGFKACAVVEWDRWACDTMNENRRRDFPLTRDWPVIHGDVRDFDYGSLEDKIDLVPGGPPCQPFSMGGKHRGFEDDRDMFPATVDAIRRLWPKAFIVENVKGLTRTAFENYFQYILLQLTYPELRRRGNEDWLAHLGRLERTKTSSTALSARLRQHAASIDQADNLNIEDFDCRFLVVEDIWIPLGENLLIAKFAPIWSKLIDGFGNQDPGSGRYNQVQSRWDVLHPGRPWAQRLRDRPGRSGTNFKGVGSLSPGFVAVISMVWPKP